MTQAQVEALSQAQARIVEAQAQAEGSPSRYALLAQAEALLEYVGSVDNAKKAEAWLELFYTRHPEKKAEAQAKLASLEAKPSFGLLDVAFYGACLLACLLQALSAWYAYSLLSN